MRRAIVSGAAGFLGSHLCDLLIGQGFRVLGLDNFSTGRYCNIEHLVKGKNFKIEHVNISIAQDTEVKMMYAFKPTHIFHLASIASPEKYSLAMIDTLWTGAAGTYELLDVATDMEARFVLASTSEVYGDPYVNPQPETYWGNVNPIGPRSCYDESKRFAEALTMAFHRELGLDSGILRLFNTYGPRMNPTDGRVVPNFIRQALNDDPITIYAGGMQTRSLCYVDDTIDAIFKMGNQRHLIGPINVGNPIEITMNDLADRICGLVGSSPPRVHVEGVGDDPRVRCPDVTRAEMFLDWKPTTSLEDGLVVMINEFRGSLERLTS